MSVEIGQELILGDLKENTVVVLVGQHRPGIGVTVWVREVTPTLVVFHAGATKTMLALRPNSRGQFFDDNHHRIHVHEFLGEVEQDDA